MKHRAELRPHWQKQAYEAGYRAGLSAAHYYGTGNLSPSLVERELYAGSSWRFFNMGFQDGCSAFYCIPGEEVKRF